MIVIQQVFFFFAFKVNTMTIKNISLLFLGALLGAAVVAGLLFHQIQNRYDIGVNSGFIAGGHHVITFLESHLKNDITSENSVDLGEYLDHKATRLSLVEINGVKTIIVK